MSNNPYVPWNITLAERLRYWDFDHENPFADPTPRDKARRALVSVLCWVLRARP